MSQDLSFETETVGFPGLKLTYHFEGGGALATSVVAIKDEDGREVAAVKGWGIQMTALILVQKFAKVYPLVRINLDLENNPWVHWSK